MEAGSDGSWTQRNLLFCEPCSQRVLSEARWETPISQLPCMASTMPFTSFLGFYKIMGLESCFVLSQATQRVTHAKNGVLTSWTVAASSPPFISPTQPRNTSFLSLDYIFCAWAGTGLRMFPHGNQLPHPLPGVSLSDLIEAFSSPPRCSTLGATFILRPGLGTSGLDPHVSYSSLYGVISGYNSTRVVSSLLLDSKVYI